MQLPKPLGRERIAAIIIFISLLIIAVTVVIINFLDVDIKNIKTVNKGLYTIETEKGPVNISSENIIRIERTYTKAALTGIPVELDKIYTDKGFLYISSLESFYENGRSIMNSVDYYGLPVWERPESNINSVKPYRYAIGTPQKNVPLVFFFISLQYIAFSFGGLSLLFLIIPYRWKELETNQKTELTKVESEYCAADEQLGMVAK